MHTPIPVHPRSTSHFLKRACTRGFVGKHFCLTRSVARSSHVDQGARSSQRCTKNSQTTVAWQRCRNSDRRLGATKARHCATTTGPLTSLHRAIIRRGSAPVKWCPLGHAPPLQPPATAGPGLPAPLAVGFEPPGNGLPAPVHGEPEQCACGTQRSR